jgi:hypothetical protein
MRTVVFSIIALLILGSANAARAQPGGVLQVPLPMPNLTPTLPSVNVPKPVVQPPPAAPAVPAASETVTPIGEWHAGYTSVRSKMIQTATQPGEADQLQRITGISIGRTFNGGREVLVAACLGQRMTGGYWAEFRSARRVGGELHVTLAEHRPAGFVTQAITHPCSLFLLPWQGENVRVYWDETPGR